jgi:hypothetical protein
MNTDAGHDEDGQVDSLRRKANHGTNIELLVEIHGMQITVHQETA